LALSNNHYLSFSKKRKLALCFNSHSAVSLNNSNFSDDVDCIYPIDLETMDTTETAMFSSYFDPYVEINSECRLGTKLYDKRVNWIRTDITMTKRKRTNNDLQSITQKTKDRATWTPLKTGGELMYSGRISSSWSTWGIRRVTSHKWGKYRNVIMTNISVGICNMCTDEMFKILSTTF
jgi:hypothetical protein